MKPSEQETNEINYRKEEFAPTEAQIDTQTWLHTLENEELVSRMTLADREKNNENFVTYRRELMYRLACAEPLIGWVSPSRRSY